MDKFKIIFYKICNKFQSPVVWASLGSLILWGLKSSGRLEIIGLTPEMFNTGWVLFTTILVSIGIINNPDDRTNF